MVIKESVSALRRLPLYAAEALAVVPAVASARPPALMACALPRGLAGAD